MNHRAGSPSVPRPRVFTWHVHGAYLYYLTQANCDFYLPVRGDGAAGYGGRAGAYPWGDNVHEVPVEAVRDTEFDVILFQSRPHYERDQYDLFSPAQHRLPKVYLEHDPPREHPTDTRHVTADTDVLLVHCTAFNRLMWDAGATPTTVIDHGVVAPRARYTGELDRGIVVINNLGPRGRRLGADIFDYVRQYVPLDLVGMGSKELGGLGEVPHDELPELVAQYRFFFNPIRYTSLGLAIIEAMMVGLPVVGLQTTELVTVIESGVNGYLALDPDALIAHMKTLLDRPDLAHQLGANAQATAQRRFSIERFARDWEALFAAVMQGRMPGQPFAQVAAPVGQEGGYEA